MKHSSGFSNGKWQLIGLVLALAALKCWLPTLAPELKNEVQAKTSTPLQSVSREELAVTQAEMQQALLQEKAIPSAEMNRIVDAIVNRYHAQRAARLETINQRRMELEASIRSLITALNIDPARIKQDPATADMMADYDALMAEMQALSPDAPASELEPNDALTTADRIVTTESQSGTRTGVAGRGDGDYYSIEAQGGKALYFSLTNNSNNQGRRVNVNVELLSADGLTSLYSFDSDGPNPTKPLRYSVPETGKYFLKVTTSPSRRRASYQLSVKQLEVQYSAEAVSGCTTFNFETGVQGWSVVPVSGPALWHLATTCRAQLPGHSTPTTFYYGQECVVGTCATQIASRSISLGSFAPSSVNTIAATCSATCNYNTCSRNASNLVSPTVSAVGTVTLSFNYLLFVETDPGKDMANVDFSTDGGTTWTPLLSKANLINDNNWHSATTSFSAGATCANVRVRFRFDTVDQLLNTFTGWHVDDVSICSTDTTPPVITCPSNITTTLAASCPPALSGVVTFPTPMATDNCGTPTVSCSPSSGSAFPVGTTTVTCTATDTAGNTASCSFTVKVFNGCLQDDSNPGNVVLFNTLTGEYRFCCNGMIFTGTGMATVRGCIVEIQHNPTDRRVLIKADFSQVRGTASLQFPPGTTKCTITDRKMTDNSCLCGT